MGALRLYNGARPSWPRGAFRSTGACKPLAILAGQSLDADAILAIPPMRSRFSLKRGEPFMDCARETIMDACDLESR